MLLQASIPCCLDIFLKTISCMLVCQDEQSRDAMLGNEKENAIETLRNTGIGISVAEDRDKGGRAQYSFVSVTIVNVIIQ